MNLPAIVLQYADDTLTVMRGELEGAVAVKQTLDLFAAFSGLKINFDKSTLVPIHMDETVLLSVLRLLAASLKVFRSHTSAYPFQFTSYRFRRLPHTFRKLIVG